MAEDRRVRRTKKQLSDALMALVLEKGYDAVRVQDITDRADVGRATLYLHYKDKADLLLNSLQETIEELFALIRENLTDPTREELFQIAFTHAAENADLYRVLLSGQGTVAHRREVQAMIGGHARSILIPTFPAADKAGIEVASVYISGALLMMIEWWLVQEMPFTAQEMAVMFRKMVLNGLVGLLGQRE
ncbi:MAG: TetR/AcrR family transcriptional regulator [Anaerolineales bacterium]|nr:TetR/AcrR family transcriptional regulator [Anaerolineales bacterium]